MKVRDTSRGRMYAVSSEIGCTAINGDMAVDVPAGGQSVILALDKKLIIDGDDNAKFVEVRWGTNAAVGSRPAPSWISDVVDGLNDILGDTPFDVNYLPLENKLVVHTDRVSDELSLEVTLLLERVVPQDVEVVRYNHNMEISWREINKYAECVTIDDMLAVNPDYKNDLTSDGEWVYPLPNLTSARQIFTRAKIRRIAIDLPKATNLQNYVAWSYTLNYVAGEFPAATLAYYMFEAQPYLTEAYMKMPAVTTLANAFPDAKLNKESVLMIIEHIPAYTSGSHPFTIGIHVDHKYDPEVNLALKKADINYEPTVELPEEVTEGKGWTLTVRWNGTPTAQTSTFDMGHLIYAKVGEMENPDGTTEQYLDWGHYVTDWEARGYEQFRSLESAYEYFNLPMPESETEEELQIEEIENA